MADPNAGRKNLAVEMYGRERPNMPADFLMASASAAIRALRECREKSSVLTDAVDELLHNSVASLEVLTENLREVRDDFRESIDACNNHVPRRRNQ